MRPVARIDALLGMLGRGQDSALLRFSLGNEYLAADDHLAAAEQLRVAVKLDAGYSAAWKLLGKALAKGGDAQGAIAAWQQGMTVAAAKGDRQAAKEMGVFMRRLQKHGGTTRK